MLYRYAVTVFAVLFFCIVLCAVCVPVSAITEPVPTRWMSPDGTPALAHEAPQYPQPLIIAQAQEQPLPVAPLAAPNGRVALVVHDSIYNALSQAITEYCWDLQAFGYDIIVYRFVSGSATSLRSYLAGLYAEPEGLKGAILIGNIPYIIYEMMQSWSGGTYEYEDFPCDMFYMDLNGTWSDTLTNGSVQPGNGKYDTRGGDLGLEIWVGRLRADNLSNLGSETTVLNTYFNKVHNYRTRTSIPNKLAIVYDDDDWSNMASGDVSAVQGVFGSGFVFGFSSPDSTTASDFKTSRLPTSTRWYLIRSHGYPGGHGFYRSGRTIFDYVGTSDYTSLDPPASFYSLFVCSGCDYTASNYLGGIIALNPQSQGLLSLGSTKTGGMWQDNYFYTPMSQQKSIGESFRLWFNQVQSYGQGPQWWYGMVMIGDPTLHPNYASYPAYKNLILSITPAGSGSVTPSAGSHSYPVGRVISVSASPAAGYKFLRWEGPVANPLSANTTVSLTADIAVKAVFTAMSPSDVKMMPDGSPVTLLGKVITYSAPNVFYVENDDRSSGIRVVKAGQNFAKGLRLNIPGEVRTESGERYILAGNISVSGTGTIKPVEISCRNLGGGNWYYDSVAGTGQKGAVGSAGLNNVGLLVRTCGKVTYKDSSSFYLDEGPGTEVLCSLPAGVVVDPNWKYVSVTGVCSIAGSTRPVILVQQLSDVIVLQ